MRTSRIAQDTSKVSKIISPTKSISRRQTRAFAASLSTFNASESKTQGYNVVLKDDSSDLEDYPSALAAPKRKRKRGVETPLAAVASVSVGFSNARTSPREAGVKIEDEDRNSIAKTKRVKRQPARRKVNEAGEVEIHAPASWEEIYDAVRVMRKRVLAPVDTMGCERLARDTMSERDQRFQTLIALMLSSQTKDTTTAAAINTLQTSLPAPGLCLETILAVEPDVLNNLIYAVGFHNNKTRYIKATAITLRDSYNGDIPDTVEGLISLPGVGPKMAYLCMSAAWGRTEGIGVDVHVHRITNLWGWHKTRGPEETRAALEAWLPKERWHEINHLLVGFGQTICTPVGRKCGDCDLAERGLCPSAVVRKEVKIKRMKKEKEHEVEGGNVAVKTENGALAIQEREVLADGGVVFKEETIADSVDVDKEQNSLKSEGS